MKISVVGLGYVGLPLSLQFARSCVSVLGLDVDAKKVELLNNGQSYIKHIEPAAIAELLRQESSPPQQTLVASKRSKQSSFVFRHR